MSRRFENKVAIVTGAAAGTRAHGMVCDSSDQAAIEATAAAARSEEGRRHARTKQIL